MDSSYRAEERSSCAQPITDYSTPARLESVPDERNRYEHKNNRGMIRQMATQVNDEQSHRTDRKRPVQAWVALFLACVSLAVFIIMATTVAGTSELGQAAIDGERGAVFFSTMGFAAAVLLSLGSILLALKPVISGRGRGIAITAAVISASAPMLAGFAG